MKNLPPTPPCDSCGRDVDEYAVVLKPLPDGEYQEVLACDNCKARYEPLRFLRIRLDRFPYILDSNPPFWTNETSLHGLFNGKQATLEGRLAFDAFPLMEDFEVVLEAFTRNYLLGKEPLSYHAKFFSLSHGYLAHFSRNDTPQELCREHFVIPCGDFATPFIDVEPEWSPLIAEPGWSLLIAEDERFVYILTFYEKEPLFSFSAFEEYEQNVWFKVEKSRYYSQWEKALQLCHFWKRKIL